MDTKSHWLKMELRVLKNSKKGKFSLCLVDIMMPFKDGFTLAKEIREIDDLVPLIFLTAKTLKEDVLKGFKLGADDYLTKPFDSEVLLENKIYP